MDRDIATALLIDVHDVFTSNGIMLGLMFGTLLGAVRENNFLPHDADDIDLFCTVNFLKDMDRWKQVVTDLKAKNITVVDVFNDSYCCLVRGMCHVDIFIPTKRLTEYIITITSTEFHFTLETFNGLHQREFLGKSFLCPADPKACLTALYGDWIKPQPQDSFTYFNATHVTHTKSVYSHYITKE